MLLELLIETLTGVSFEIRASPMETIMSIKHKIQRSEGIPVSQQHLIWKNEELEDHRHLRDYEIGGGSTLRLVLGLRGGPLNAHRIPPLRLTPIRLTPSSHAATKYATHFSGRLKQLPRFTLPSLPTRYIPSGKTSTDSHLPSIKVAPSEVLDDEFNSKTATSVEDNRVNIRHLVTRLRPLDKDKKAEGLLSLDLPSKAPFRADEDPDIAPSGSLLSFTNVTSIDRLNVSNDLLGTTASLNEICSQSSSLKKPMSSNPELYGRLEELSSLVDYVSQSAGHTKVQSSDSLQHGSLDRKSGNNSRAGNIHFGRGVAASGERSVSNRKAERYVHSPSGYPPLFTTNLFHRHLGLSDFDIHSRWRLYDSPGLASNTFLSRFRPDHSPVTGGTDEDNGTTPATASEQNGVGRSSPMSHKPQPNGPLPTDLSCDEFSLSTSTAAAGRYPTTPAATLLAGLFSSATDHAHRVPFQTSGVEHSLSRLGSYPFHWLRQASPLLETSELPERSLDTAGLWDADELDDCEAIADIPFDLDTDDPDEDDDCSVELKSNYPCDIDDEDDGDSLADLEEYLFYYHTGGLLFGPSSLTTDYSPHHRYGLRDWRDFDAESASFEMENSETVKYHDNIAWHQERSQLMEKVKELKGRMKELKIRRQKRRRVLNQDHTTDEQPDISSDPTNGNTISTDPIADNSTCMPLEGNHPLILKEPNNPHSSSNLHSSISRSDDQLSASQNDRTRLNNIDACEDIRRHRRFGTVTPPVFSSLMNGSGILPSHDLPTSYISSWPLACVTPTDCSQLNPLSCEPLKPQPSSIHSSAPVITGLCAPDALLTSTNITPTDCRTASSFELRSSTNNFNPRINVSASSSSDDETHRADLLSRSKQHKNSTVTSAVPFLPSLGKSPPGLVTAPVGVVRSPIGSRIPTIPLLTVDQSSPSENGVVCNTSFIQPIRVVLPLSPRNDNNAVPPRSPPKSNRSPVLKRRRCSLCLRKTGLANSYACRCGRNFCSRHRYAEVHACQFDYKAEARRMLLNANPVVTAPKLPKI